MSKQLVIVEHQGQLVARYRRYMNLSQHDLAEAMHLSLRTVQRMEQEFVIHDPERRRFLVGLLGIPAAKMLLDDELLPVQKQRPPLNEDQMSFIEGIIDAR